LDGSGTKETKVDEILSRRFESDFDWIKVSGVCDLSQSDESDS
jgi:hypothetical protein